MPTVVVDLLQSKKFIFTLLVTALVLGASKFAVITSEEAQAFLKFLWPAYLGAQGLADLGKSAAKAKAFPSSSAPVAAPAVTVAVEEDEKKTDPPATSA